MEERVTISESEIFRMRKDKLPGEKVDQLYGSVAVPSYVHGYSLAIEYMRNWFESKFDKDYFKGGIYVDGKHVLDDYKHFSKNIIKGQNPRARIAPTIEFDYDREGIDHYPASPELYLRRSNFEESFFKDHDKKIYLGLNMRALRMNFNFKVRVSTRAQQLDLFNHMELAFRVGATQSDYISVDFHIPMTIMMNIAEKAGFQISNGRIVNIIGFLEYINSRSDLPFLFKIRAVNQKPEFFIRITNLHAHIAVRDKLQVDDGERDGKLDTNFCIEMTAVLTIPIPHFYAYYSASDITMGIEYKESDDTVAIYSIAPMDIPKTDENNWNQAAISEYFAEIGDSEIDLSSIFTGDNPLGKAVNHDLTRGLSPSKFINVKILHSQDVAKLVPSYMDWETMTVKFKKPIEEEAMLNIAIYYDRVYINNLSIEMENYNNSRIS